VGLVPRLSPGRPWYRLVADIGRDEYGKRKQVICTFDKLKEARAELARVRHKTGLGMCVRPSNETVNAYLDSYLRGARLGAGGNRPSATTGEESADAIDELFGA
jgi:hypothetical protein